MEVSMAMINGEYVNFDSKSVDEVALLLRGTEIDSIVLTGGEAAMFRVLAGTNGDYASVFAQALRQAEYNLKLA